MTTYYIATQTDSMSSNGYLVANGDAFVARSGGYSRGNVPEGSYSLGDADELPAKHKKGMSPNDKNWRKYKKFYISGVGPGEIKDPRYPRENRTGVRFHYDGNGPGTAGCIGYDTIEAQNALKSAYDAGDRQVKVIHVRNDAEARAKVRELTGEDAPVNTRGLAQKRGGSELGAAGGTKKKPPRKRKAAQRSGRTSKIRHGAKMAEGERTVLLGKKRLTAAHRKARHTGGGRIAMGSRSVFVGKKLLAFGRVTDPTTDGSQVSTGEGSVMVG